MRFTRTVIGLTLALCVASLAACDNNTQASKHAVPVLTTQEQQILDTARADLAALADRSQTARELLSFYDRNAIRAKYIDEGHFQVIGTVVDALDFFVVANPRPRELEVGQDAICAEFFRESRSLTLTTSGFGSLARGLLLAHEVVHARDCTEGGEPVSEPLSDIWLQGEANAHYTVFTILQEVTHGAWGRTVQESSIQRQQLSVAQGHQPATFTIGILPEDEERIRHCISLETPSDISFFATDMIVSANVLTIQKHARTNEERTNGVLEFLHVFYSMHSPLQERLRDG